ncbi:reelin domain-containing protein 1 isoform X2 [Macrotis lagotis]
MKIQIAIIGWACATFCLVSCTDAFSHGASFVACVDMKPRHIRAQLQNPRNNYITIYTNMSSYSPGDKVPVTVRSRGDFMGFLLQARKVSNDQIVGTFVLIPSGSRLMSCFEEANTVTHSDKSPKRNLSFVWKAPEQPIGDIKFFLSVVQSYFIYWERIESTVVSQQTQNRTLSDGNMEPAASLQKPNSLEVTTTGSISSGSRPESAVLGPTGTSGTDPMEPDLGGLTSEVPGSDLNLLKPSPLLAETNSNDHSRQPNWDRPPRGSDQTLEPSLDVQGLERALSLGHFPLEDPDSRHNRIQGSSGSDSGTAMPCFHCDGGAQERPEAPNLTLVSPPSSLGAPFPGHLSYSRLVMGDTKDEAQSSGGPASAASVITRTLALGLSGFQSESLNPREEGDGGEGTGLPLMVHLELPTLGAGLKKDGPPPRTGLVPTQLGILLCLSVTLGMALAAALHRLHKWYCRQRTEVSFGEPTRDIIAMTDSGERMHFRKIRENSVMLVQAEYNWIPPSGGAKRTAV